MTAPPKFSPGATMGIVGSGQLGRMLAQAAAKLGFHTHVYSPEKDSPAEQVCDEATVAKYDDRDALAKFASQVDVVTFEFENLPFESLGLLEEKRPVRPSPQILYIAQHRRREKEYLDSKGFPVVPFANIAKASDVDAAVKRVGLPAVLKTAGFGYDGKGQHKVNSAVDAKRIVEEGGSQSWVLEQWQDFEKEVSVIVARGLDGKMADWGTIENRHRNHILDVSIAPAEVAPAVNENAVEIARKIAQSLDLVGLLCVEFFVARNGSLRVNELAPRPHNSGHWTIEGAVTSQFEQQARAVCGLPLGATEIVGPTAMANILGDLWSNGEPKWEALSAHPFVKWHGYGKKEARPGRKMGHLTASGKNTHQAAERVLAARRALQP